MKTIGKYQVLGEIGRSAAGATYRARDPFRKPEFALKLLSPLAALGGPDKDRLYVELAACAELSHRHIAKILDLGEVEGGVYVATELLKGADLRVHLAGQDLGIAHKLALMAQVCEGLAYARSKGVTHGNMKPGNIFVVDGTDAIVLDYGIGSWQNLLIASGARLSGLLPNYFAPEQILGQRFDERSDVFSIGVVLYEVLTGRYPFQAAPGVVTREIVHSEPRALRKLNPQIPEELEQLVVRALNKDPQARIQTADELAAGLYTIAQQLRKERPAPQADAPAQIAIETGVENQAKESEVSGPSQLTFDSLVAPVTPPASVEAPAPSPAPSPAIVPAVVPGPPVLAPLPAPVATVQPPARSSAPTAATLPPPHAAALERVVPRYAHTTPAAPRSARGPVRGPSRMRRRLVTFAVGAVLAISLVSVIVSRQNLRASQNKHNEPAAAAASSDPQKAAAPDATIPTLVPAEPVPAPSPQAVAEHDAADPATLQVLRVEVKSLWETGRYTEAMRLVDGVLAASPANAEARAWKKKIRAAEDAEAALK